MRLHTYTVANKNYFTSNGQIRDRPGKPSARRSGADRKRNRTIP